MKVTHVEIIPVSIPMKKPFGISGGFIKNLDHIIVKLHTSNGLIGYGEGIPLPAYSEETQEEVYFAIKNFLANCVVNEEPMNIERIIAKMDKAVPGHNYAKAAIEFAIWDLIGKDLKMPVYKLIGGLYRDKVKLAWSIGYASVEEMVNEAVEKVKEGYRVIKVKIGRGEKIDLEVVKSVREAIGDSIPLRVDANQGYSLDVAFKILRKMEQYNLQLIEQPINKYDLEGMARLARALDTPILADESVFGPDEAMRVIKANAADIINIKIAKPGGIYNAKKVAAIAESAGIPCEVGSNFEFAIGTAAGVHLAVSTRNIVYECELIGPCYMVDDVSKEPYLPKNGYLELPKGNGLGIEVDEEKLEKYKVEIKP
jgi:muconate/chloromuconate cycloisomerase